MTPLLDAPRPLSPALVWGLPLAMLAGMALVLVQGGNAHWFLVFNQPRLPDGVWAAFTTLGDSLTAFCILLALARRRPDMVAAGLIAAVFATLLTQLPKHVLDVARPVMALGDAVHVIGPTLRHGSFPSGHTTTAFVMLALAAAFLRNRAGLLWLFPLAALAGVSRIAVGAHWPLDVLAGAALGWVCGMTGVWIAHGIGLRRLNAWAQGFLLLAAVYYLTGYDSRQPLTDGLEKGIALAALLTYLWTYWLPPGRFRLRLGTPSFPCAALPRNSPGRPKSFLPLEGRTERSEGFRGGLILLSVCATLALWRLWARQHAGVELFFDEAYYWGWSRHLDWGYYSKPPMVAWVIRLGTELFGPSETGIRAGAALLYPLTAGLIFLFTRRLFAHEPEADAIALAAGLAFITLPVVSFGSWFMTTDAPLMFFGALAIWAYLRAAETNRWRDWLLLGAALGLGALSKYTMVFFALGIGLHSLFQADRRRRLASRSPSRSKNELAPAGGGSDGFSEPGAQLTNPRLWAAGLLALALLAPNLIWNAQHQFASFKHTAEISHLDRAGLRPAELASFVAAQFGLMGPVLMTGLALLLLRRATWRDERLVLLACFSLPALLAFCGLALTSRAFANWAAFAYVAATPLVAAAWWRSGRRGWLTLALATNLALGAGLYHWHDIARALDQTLVRKTDPYHRVHGWSALGREVAEELAAHPDARLAGEARDLLAQASFYGGPRAADPLIHNPEDRIRNHFDLTASLRSQPHGEFLFITYSETVPLKLFREGERVRIVSTPLLPDLTRVIYLWRVRDYVWTAP
ncbi:MAG: glycosyltransferase family 39 protein [Betaproteobacteria bacterium]|nr:glycosyltransferase family 39 protein [Betaproteobacteria bacterium]